MTLIVSIKLTLELASWEPVVCLLRVTFPVEVSITVTFVSAPNPSPLSIAPTYNPSVVFKVIWSTPA